VYSSNRDFPTKTVTAVTLRVFVRSRPYSTGQLPYVLVSHHASFGGIDFSNIFLLFLFVVLECPPEEQIRLSPAHSKTKREKEGKYLKNRFRRNLRGD